MSVHILPRVFPGILYAGDGTRLAGDGPDPFTDAHGDTLPFKAVLRSTPPLPGQAAELQAGDRLWVLPESLGMPPEVPAGLLHQLAMLIRAGGTVGLAARDASIGACIRDMLMLLLMTPESRA